MTQPTGVFVRLPLSDAQRMTANEAPYKKDRKGSALEASILSIGTPVTGGPVSVVDYSEYEPKYHDQGMGSGLEDRGIHDRYEAMGYGWDQAMERVCSEFPETVLLSDHLAALALLQAEVGQKSERIVELEEELTGFRAGMSELIAKEVATLKGPEA